MQVLSKLLVTKKISFRIVINYTFVVIPTVVALLLEKYTAVFAVPTVVTLALPLAVGIAFTLTVTRTRVGTTLQRAVPTVPTGHAETSAIFTLTVLIAAWITLFEIAQFTGPAEHTFASVVDAVTMHAAIQITQLCN